MKTLAIVSCVLALLCAASALPTIAPNAQDCGNGIFCAPSQTCMSNATGAGLEVGISATLTLAPAPPLPLTLTFSLPAPLSPTLFAATTHVFPARLLSTAPKITSVWLLMAPSSMPSPTSTLLKSQKCVISVRSV